MSKVKTKPDAHSATGITAAIEAAAVLRGAVQGLEQRRQQLTEERNALSERNRALLGLPLRKEEARQVVFDFIDAKAAGFERLAGWGDALQNFAQPKGYRPPIHAEVAEQVKGQPMRHGGLLNMADILGDALRSPGSIGQLVGVSGFLGEQLGATGGDVLQRALYYFFGDVIKERVGAYFDRHFPQPPQVPGNTADGLTIQQRQAEIERNDERLTEIEVELVEVGAQIDSLAVVAK